MPGRMLCASILVIFTFIGASQSRPGVRGIPCPIGFDPVCGNDRRIYWNECFLNLNRTLSNPYLRKSHNGPCEWYTKSLYQHYTDLSKKFNCSVERAQVCGTDGVTYQNECVLEFLQRVVDPKIKKMHDGPCRNGPIDLTASLVINQFDCPFIEAPVCGNDGVTYFNECIMRFAKLLVNPLLGINHDGPCRKNPIDSTYNLVSTQYDCPNVKAPVCGNDGVTYFNECTMRFVKLLVNPFLRKKHNGPCRKKSMDSIYNSVGFNPHCPKYYAPVCASDGKDYWNECYLEWQRAHGLKIFKVYDGVCNYNWILS